MNVTILCGYPNSSYARDVLRALRVRGLSRVSVVAAAGGSAPRTVSALWAAHGWRLPWQAARWIADRLVQKIRLLWNPRPASSDTLAAEVQAQEGQFVCVREINGEECHQALRALQVDLLILAGTPIVQASILAVPRLGTLNAHQGALPQFRGMNVIEWAVLEGHPPSISVHFVDPGVDTGDIVATEPVPILAGDTLNTVRRRASVQQVDLLARTVSAALTGPLLRRSQCREEGQQYFPMHPRLRAVAEQRLQEYVLAYSAGEGSVSWQEEH